MSDHCRRTAARPAFDWRTYLICAPTPPKALSLLISRRRGYPLSLFGTLFILTNKFWLTAQSLAPGVTTWPLCPANPGNASKVCTSPSLASVPSVPKTTLISTVACNECRAGKARCDGARPSCGKCTLHGIPCVYEVPQPKANVTKTYLILPERRACNDC
jgi:hypothetical protein